MRSLDRAFKSRLNGTGLKPLVQYIKDLFSNNEQGVWYDPSDLSTLYQDAAGTIPVTAVEQPVGLMLDKSKGLVLGPELVPNGDFSQGATGWTVLNADATHIVTFADGGMRYQSDTTTPSLYVLAAAGTLPAGKTYQVEAVCSKWASGSIKLFDTTNGTLVVDGVGKFTARITPPVGIQVIILRRSANVDLTLDSISVREIAGNHASQITATSRPVLSAMVNQFLNSELTGAVAGAPGTPPTSWLSGNSTGEIGTSAVGVRFVANATRRTAYQSIVLAANTAYRMRCKVNVAVPFAVSQMLGTTTAAVFSVRYYCDGQAVSSNFAPSVGEHEVVLDFVSPSTSGNFTIQIGAGVQNTTTGDVTFLKTDFRVANTGTNLPDYQRVNTATDYDTAGFPYYLKFDGADDWLVTPSINFTSTDKMMVCAGVRRLADTASQMIVELGTNGEGVAGSWFLAAQYSASYNLFANSLGVTANGCATAALQGAAPTHDVVSFRSDLAGSTASDRLKFRRNSGTFAAVSAPGSLGTGGTYGNYPLYIGRRGGTSLPFNGHLYGLIIRGAATSDSQIKSVERYVNTKTRAYTT